MQYIEWENGVCRMSHRKLIQGLSLHDFYVETTEIYGTKSEGKASKLFTIWKRECYSRLCQSYSNEEKSLIKSYVSGS